MYKKVCPECGEDTVRNTKRIWTCRICGAHLDHIVAEPINIEEYRSGQDKPDWEKDI